MEGLRRWFDSVVFGIALLAQSPLGIPSFAAAQLSPAADQFQVNTYTTSGQGLAAVSADAAGNFVVVWESLGSSGTDSSGTGVQARRYDAAGTPRGAEFQVNSYTPGSQRHVAVAAGALGNFVVVWQSYGSGGSDTSGYSIQGQRYAASGEARGSEFQVNSYTTFFQRHPAVAADALGNFVVVWDSYGSSGTDTSGFSVQARRYDANGVALGGEFQVNTYTTGAQRYPAVASDLLGNFVVVWESSDSSGTDTSSWSVQARRFDRNGTPQGSDFQVNTWTLYQQYEPAVSADAAGNFVVVWESRGSAGTDTSGWSVQARRYDASGAALGAEFQVNTYTSSHQRFAAVSSDAGGNFVVVWESEGSSGGDTFNESIQARHFKANGVPLGAEAQVNTFTTSSQESPAVAPDASGNFVVVWHSNGSSGGDTDGFSVQARLYDGLFRDGFETADSSRWSSTPP